MICEVGKASTPKGSVSWVKGELDILDLGLDEVVMGMEKKLVQAFACVICGLITSR